MTAQQITKQAIAELTAKGCRVRRVHNVSAYRNRRNHVEKGWPDIQGYDRNGKVVLCEVKAEGDVFSSEQLERLQDCHRCGGLALFADDSGLHAFSEIVKKQTIE
jgi:RecB family endonuclease NucS